MKIKDKDFVINTTVLQEDSLYDHVLDLISRGDLSEVSRLFIEDIHVSEVVNILESLDKDARNSLIEFLPEDFYKDTITWMPTFLVQEILDIKGLEFIVSLIQENKDTDFPYFIVKDLDNEDKHLILDAISLYKRKAVEKKLNYPKDSAGRLMQGIFISVLKDWKVAQCLNYINEIQKVSSFDISNTYDVFITDDKGIAYGMVSLAKLCMSAKDSNIMDLKSDNFRAIDTNVDQEEVALLFRKRGFLSVAVINDAGFLVGSITIDDIIDVIYQETQEDLLLVSGVQNESLGRYKTIFYVSKSRLKWLSFNFIEALMIPLIVTVFSDILSTHVILAALIQFVVALGGNAGMQSLAVTLRGLTLKLITKTNVWSQIGKEISIACINGLILGLIGYLWGSFWGEGMIIGLITFIAVFINILLGTFFGTLYPIALKKFGIDPAIASSVCVTTSTDIVGFFFVLLVATLML